MKAQYFLYNGYTGSTDFVCDTQVELVEHLRKIKESGNLWGEAVYEVFYGRHLATGQFWSKAFDKERL